MKAFMQLRTYLICLLLALPFGSAMADEDDAKYASTINVFKQAGKSGSFFNNSYGYAVFPTIGKAGFVVGGAYGKGRVYAADQWVGNTTVTHLNVGFQLGAQGYSQIIFFEDQRAFNEFTGGNFEFSADASAVAITAGASAAATTTGSSAGASGGRHDATTVGAFYKGMATFTVAKGGLMYQVTIGGQKFSYTPK